MFSVTKAIKVTSVGTSRDSRLPRANITTLDCKLCSIMATNYDGYYFVLCEAGNVRTRLT